MYYTLNTDTLTDVSGIVEGLASAPSRCGPPGRLLLSNSLFGRYINHF